MGVTPNKEWPLCCTQGAQHPNESMPYDGADPEAARAWVTDTLPTLQGAGDVRTATFGGVEYQLYGIPTARALEIGTLQ